MAKTYVPTIGGGNPLRSAHRRESFTQAQELFQELVARFNQFARTWIL
jgi:hypothetical protein